MHAPDASAKPTVRRTFKYRLYPTKGQVASLEEQLEACCDLYNAALEQRRWAYGTTGRSPSRYDQYHDLAEARRAGLLPEGMSATAQRSALTRLDRAFTAFFRRCKAGEKPGYPRFRSRSRYDSLAWPEGNGASFRGTRVRLQGVGSVRVRLHRPLPPGTEVREVAVRRQTGRWYVCVSCLVPYEERKRDGPAVGIDLGVRSFIALSTGEIILGLQEDRKRLRRASHCVSRRRRGSKRRKKAVALLARQKEREANRRRDFAHKLSRQLVTSYGLIAVEDLMIPQMRRSARGTVEEPGRSVRAKAGLNRGMAEQGWGQFLGFLEYKAAEACTQVIKVDPRKTSQTCSNCGEISRSKSEIRRCSCGLVLDRDVNAARNILARGLERSLQALTVGEEVRAVA